MTEPRTIVFVGNARHAWCTEVALWKSLESLGHTVVFLQEDEMDWPALPALVEQVSAHMVLWVRTWSQSLAVVSPVLDRLREMGVPSIAWHLDLFLPLDRRHQVRDEPFFAATSMLATPHDSDEWKSLGIRHWWSPPGVFDQETGLVGFNKRRWPHRVVFVGSGSHAPYPHPEWAPVRGAVIDAFQAAFGRDFGRWPKPRQPVRGRDLQELYATAEVVLGDSCLVGQPAMYLSDRVPETLGRGGFLIHPEVPGMVGKDVGPMGYEDGVHLRSYPAGDGAAAVEIARWALANPVERAEIAAAGRALVLSRDLYTHRMAALLVEVERQFGWNDREYATAFDGTGTLIARYDVTPRTIERLEIGSGSFPTDGFTHLDIDPSAPGVDIVGPMFPLDLPDGSVSEIRAVDCLEHCSFRDTATALREWARVLRPGGRIYVQVPDADLIMRWFANEPSRLLDRLPADLPQTPLAGATWRLLGGHADGVQGAGDVDFRLNAHFALFSERSLRDALDAAGFDVESLTVNEHPNLCVIAVKR